MPLDITAAKLLKAYTLKYRGELSMEDFARIVMSCNSLEEAFNVVHAQMGGPPTTAAQDLEDNPQYILTAEYWRRSLLDAGKEVPPKNYWTTGAQNVTTGGRPLLDIVTDIGPKLLRDLAALAQKSSNGRLALYRTMPESECQEIMAWYSTLKADTEAFVGQRAARDTEAIREAFREQKVGAMPIRGHVGDEQQARSYLAGTQSGRSGEIKVLVSFVLKPGAHELLFTPQYMVLAPTGIDNACVAEYERQLKMRSFFVANRGEGGKRGYIGLKSEDRGDFSLLPCSPQPSSSEAADSSKLLFQLFVDEIEKVEHKASASAQRLERGPGRKARRG